MIVSINSNYLGEESTKAEISHFLSLDLNVRIPALLRLTLNTVAVLLTSLDSESVAMLYN